MCSWPLGPTDSSDAMLLFPAYDSPTTTMASFQFNGAKPKGLWKVRGTQHPRLANPLTTTVVDTKPNKKQDNNSSDLSDSSSVTSSETSSPPPPPEEIRVAPVWYWDYSHTCITHPDRLNKWKMGTKSLDTSSIVGPGQAPANKASFGLEDWKDLRDLAIEAKKIYDSKVILFFLSFFLRMIYPIISYSLLFHISLDHDLENAIQSLRAVIHECHQCLKIHPDPSVVFAAPLHKKKVGPPPLPPQVPPICEWYNDPSHSRARGPKITPFPPLSPSPEPEEEW